MAIACWWSRYKLARILSQGPRWGKMAVRRLGGAPLGPDPVIRRIARRQSDSDPIERIRNLSPVASLEPLRHCQQTRFVAGTPMRRRGFLILLAGPATLPVISPLRAAVNVACVGEPRREYYWARFSRRPADHQRRTPSRRLGVASRSRPQLWVHKQLKGAYHKGGYHEPFRHSFNRRHYRHGTY